MNMRDKVTELLKNYRSYQYAMKQYETTGWVAISGTGYSDMPRGGGFGSRAPVRFAVDSLEDTRDYNRYRRIVDAIDGALHTLGELEESIIRFKWMHDLTLVQIAERKNYSVSTIKRTHKQAFRKLVICLQFEEIPEIEQIAVAQ